MKGTIIIFAVALLSVGCKSQLVDRVIKFTVTETADYCGGAAPSDEMLEAFRVQKPFNGTIYVHSKSDRSDDGQKLTIANGEIKQAGFVEGQYFIFNKPKFDRREADKGKMDDEMKDCMEMTSFQSINQFTVTKETKSVEFNVHKMCDPCLPPRP